MSVFVGWSGPLSHQVACILREWLPRLIPDVSVFVSSSDIAKGGRWSSELSQELAVAECGIFCVTRENVHSTWLSFEAGALAAQADRRAPVLPFLVDLEARELAGPLSQFQATAFTREDFERLLLQVAGASAGHSGASDALSTTFAEAWPLLSDALCSAVAAAPEDPFVEVFGANALEGEGFNLVYGELALTELPGQAPILRFQYTKPGAEGIIFSIETPVSSCDLRASNYLAGALSRAGTATIGLHSDVELKDRLDLSFVAFGGPLSNHKTTDVLDNGGNNLMMFDQEHSSFHVMGDRYQTVERKAGYDHGLILKIHPCQFPERTWITCAGLGEWGTSGAAWYLANRWRQLHEQVGAAPFAAVIRVEPGRDESGEIVHLRTG